jgi:hypothetical protein
MWLIAVHGEHSDYVRNLTAQPQVRIRHLGRWQRATATVHPMDPERLRSFGLYARMGPATLGIEPRMVRLESDQDFAHLPGDTSPSPRSHSRSSPSASGRAFVTGDDDLMSRPTIEKATAHRIQVTAAKIPSELDDADYIDIFDVTYPSPDDRTPEQLARSALDATPVTIGESIRLIHRLALGFQLGPRKVADHILGWRIIESTDAVLRLRAESRLMTGTLVLTRTGPASARLISALQYKDDAARYVWRLVGPIHRLAAPVLLKSAQSVPKLSRGANQHGNIDGPWEAR